MPQTDYSSNYLLYNAEASKKISIVVKFDGLDTLLSNVPVYKRFRYGDPYVYGTPNVVYGGLVEITDASGSPLFKTLLDLTGGSLTLSQRLEPEQGRGAISTLSMSFIDLNQYMTKLISPGILIDDILGKKVTVYLGYQEISYPEDYTPIFRGRVSAYSSDSGRVTLQFSDPNMVRRQQVFYIGQTVSASAIGAADTTIPVVTNADFFKQIIGPDGSYDPGVKTYIQIGSETIEYPATGYGVNAFNGCVRGARGTVAASAAASAAITAAVELTDNAIDMALKLMLSGWNGPWVSGVSVSDFVYSPDPTVSSNPQMVVLGNSKSANRDYGISVGDYITITGAASSGNNVTATVLQLIDFDDRPEAAIITDTTFTLETASTASISARSQYDTYPIGCGTKLPADEVDVTQHIYIKDTFMGSDENKLRFFINTTESSCKTFIESQVYLPCAMYSLTRFGRMSCQLTHAPLADQRLQFLTGDNVLDPQTIQPSRGVNSRKFFNEISWTYDYADDGSTFASVLNSIDSDSISIIGVTVILPITAKGIKSAFGSQTVVDRRSSFLLSRYKSGAVTLSIKVNWEVGTLIEAGDVVAVKDGGVLQISNLLTGGRNLGTALFEVINREMDIKSGSVKLTLVSGLGAESTDRYATISPSTVLQSGSTNPYVILGDSYGALFPTQEYRKWNNYTGSRVKIHDAEYATSATGTIVGFDAVNPNIVQISGLSLASSALPGLIMDVDDYSTSADILDQQAVKVVHAFQSKEVLITGGVSASAFTVDPSSLQYFQLGFPASIHDLNFTQASPEVTISAIDTGTNTITVSKSMGFTPASGYFVDLLGFPDGTAAYRWV